MQEQSSIEPQAMELAEWAVGLERSALQSMLMLASRPGIISFGLGLPAAELFPAGEMSAAVASVLESQKLALQYGPPFMQLKTHIVSLMRRRSIECTEGQVFLTAGAQQGMSLVARLLLGTGSEVVVEELTYPGFQQVLQPFRPCLLTVPTDLETGLDVEALETLLKAGARPALIYCVTDGHNPCGVSMDAAKRERLVSLAVRYRVPILEDDAYGFIQYEDNVIPPLRSFNDRWVFYVGSFSKILAPTLRVGWIIIPEDLMSAFSIIKEASDIDTATLAQRSISAYIDMFDLYGHIEKLKQVYRQRRDSMLRALETHLGARSRWSRPRSGLFIWVEMVDFAVTTNLLKTALEAEKVAFIPGSAFSVRDHSKGWNCLRLNFSNSTPDLIDEGIGRLARLISERSG